MLGWRWKGTQRYIQECDTCQRNKYITTAPRGLLQPLPISSQVWEDISMDFITCLPQAKGFELIFVVVDRLSKYSHFIPLKCPYSARVLCTAYHPQMDGLTEVINCCLEIFLCCFITDQSQTWVVWLLWAEYWYNTSFHGSTSAAPFEAVYGRPPPVTYLVFYPVKLRSKQSVVTYWTVINT